jgi:hypothetical protein
VLIEQVYAIGLEPFQHAFRRGLDVIGTAVQPAEVLSGLQIDVPPELCCDHHLIADRSECLAHNLLVSERAIDLGSIKEGDAAPDGRPYQGDHVLLVRGRAIAHASKPKGRDLKVAFSEFPLLHIILH